MISGFKRISPVLSGQPLAKRKLKTYFSKAIGKATLQRNLHYKVICQLVIVNGKWDLLFCLNYLTKTGKYDKTFPCEAERLTPASRQNGPNSLYLNIKILGAMQKFFSQRLRIHKEGSIIH